MIPLTPQTILISQIIAHLSVIPMILYGSWQHWLVAVFVYFLNGCFGMTMTYHRLLSHKAWNPPKWMEYLFTLFATIGLTGSAISWIAIHRKHHVHVDTERDPHSPKYIGWFRAHYLSMFANVEIKYASHLIKQKFYQFQHKHYLDINIVYAVLLYLIDPFAVIYAWLFPAMLLWNGGSSIVSISHRGGKIHNDTIMSLLVWGEGYHETHHKHAGWKRFGKYDLGGVLIELIEKWYKPKDMGKNA
jgi:stearoyl-CoA desaturase (delta-9 desaturase)